MTWPVTWPVTCDLTCDLTWPVTCVLDPPHIILLRIKPSLRSLNSHVDASFLSSVAYWAIVSPCSRFLVLNLSQLVEGGRPRYHVVSPVSFVMVSGGRSNVWYTSLAFSPMHRGKYEHLSSSDLSLSSFVSHKLQCSMNFRYFSLALPSSDSSFGAAHDMFEAILEYIPLLTPCNKKRFFSCCWCGFKPHTRVSTSCHATRLCRESREITSYTILIVL